MTTFITLFISFIGLLWAANHLVTGASSLAGYYRISPLIIGLTLVAFGASTPEIMIAITAALEGRNELAIGNAIGTNIANIGLVLGLTILLRPLSTKSSLLRREFPLLFLMMLFTYSLMLDGYLSVMDGALLLIVCFGLVGYFIILAKRSPRDPMAKEFAQALAAKRNMKTDLISIVIGLTILPLSSHYLVISATQLARWLGTSDYVMGLTIVAIGSSLSNLATSLVAAFKGHDDIAVGNVLGSNMFNMLIVMSFPGIINPSAINHAILWRDIPIMFAITLVLLYINYHYKKRIERWHGGLLLLIYACYMISLFYDAAG